MLRARLEQHLPAIFGALFQSIMDDGARRNLGAHYTSEENILKLIKPLFLDELHAEFGRIKGNRNKLVELHKKLRGPPSSTLPQAAATSWSSPTANCASWSWKCCAPCTPAASSSTSTSWIRIDVDQFYGIEIEEFPAQIAQVALWADDHQMNVRVSEEFGLYFARILLRTTPHIDIAPTRCGWIGTTCCRPGARVTCSAIRRSLAQVHGRHPASRCGARCSWASVMPVYSISSPPGMSRRRVAGTAIRCAFVSTNSISQGEQVGVLWGWLLAQGIHIHFAHRTFQWSNEARGMAAVHCVIIGFGHQDFEQKVIFEYEDIRGEPHAVIAKNINPYLVDGPDVVLPRRSKPLCDAPAIGIGNKPIDDGNYLFTAEEKAEFLKLEPGAAKWFRRWLGADEFINGYERWCLWLGDCPPGELRQMLHAGARWRR